MIFIRKVIEDVVEGRRREAMGNLVSKKPTEQWPNADTAGESKMLSPPII